MMLIPTSRFRQILFFQLLLFLQLQSPVLGQDQSWKNDPKFQDLRTELQEVTATQLLTKSYLEIQKLHPKATKSQAVLLNHIRSQITPSTRRLALTINGVHELPELPSIFATDEQIADLYKKLPPAFRARKAAYIELFRETSSIPKLSIISTCLLHELNALTDDQALAILLEKYRSAFERDKLQPIITFTIDQKEDRKIEALTTLIQLAEKLDALPKLEALSQHLPRNNSWAHQECQRLAALTPLYAAANEDQFVDVGKDALSNKKVSTDDLTLAASFKKFPPSAVANIYLAILDTKKSNLLTSEDVLKLLRIIPAADSELAARLTSTFLGSETIGSSEKDSLAGKIIRDEQLIEKFANLIPPLLDKVLASVSESSSSQALGQLQPVAELISKKLLKRTNPGQWNDCGLKLITTFLKIPDSKQLDENFANQLLAIADIVNNEILLNQVAGITAKSFTWPALKVYWFLKTEKYSTASVIMDHCKADNLFSPHFQKFPNDLVSTAEAALELPANQKNTFIAMLMTKSIMHNKARKSQISRAMELQEIITKRWGAVEHSNKAFLQQGNRVLMRYQTGDLSPALPALREWAEENPLEQLVLTKNPRGNLFNAQKEIWNNCLLTGHFGKDLNKLIDLLVSAGIRGDASTHRSITDALSKLIHVSSFGKPNPKSISNNYPAVRAWLMIYADSLHPLQLPLWSGLSDELQGLGLSKEESGTILTRILTQFTDPNLSKDFRGIKSAQLLAGLANSLDTSLEFIPLAQTWRVGSWNPTKQGDPETIFKSIDKALGGMENREAWAYFLFASSYLPQVSTRQYEEPNKEAILKRSQEYTAWAEGLRKAASGSWLENLANEFHKNISSPSYLDFSAISHSEFNDLPLGLRHRIATDPRLERWLQDHPEHLTTALPLCVNTICEAITKAPTNLNASLLSRHYEIGELDEIILSHYKQHADSFRPLTKTLRQTFDTAISRHQETVPPQLEGKLSRLRNLVLELEALGK